jgi:hypothetical protein
MGEGHIPIEVNPLIVRSAMGKQREDARDIPAFRWAMGFSFENSCYSAHKYITTASIVSPQKQECAPLF